jgi:peptide/nickel transport system permease protein
VNHFRQQLLFVLKRLIQAIPVLWGIAILNFFLVHMAPGNPADVLAGEAGSATPEYMAMLRAQFGLDQPLWKQLLSYMTNLLQLDLGYSWRHGMPVLELILDRLGPTLLLMTSTLLVAVGVGILLGLFAALRVGQWRDSIISTLAIISYATPLFWVGLMLILVFSLKLDLLPATGMENVIMFYEGWDRVVDILQHLILPTVTLSLFYLALYTRLMRASILEQHGMDYVVTARAKGVSERGILYRHILKNAILPVVTMAGFQTGAMLGGSVVVEAVFGWPGLGQLAFQTLFARDYNLLLGIFFLSSLLVVLINLLVDLIYTFLDPRIELR